jgi:hypothetical protein
MLARPVPEPGQEFLRPCSQGEVDHPGSADSKRADQREDQRDDQVGDGLLASGDAGLRDRGAASDDEQQVLRIGAGQDDSQAERPDRPMVLTSES